MVNFERAVAILAIELGAIEKEMAEERALFIHGKREIAFTRLPKLERDITQQITLKHFDKSYLI